MNHPERKSTRHLLLVSTCVTLLFYRHRAHFACMIKFRISDRVRSGEEGVGLGLSGCSWGWSYVKN